MAADTVNLLMWVKLNMIVYFSIELLIINKEKLLTIQSNENHNLLILQRININNLLETNNLRP